MRLVGWNISQGGGARVGRIVNVLSELGADLVVISEYRATGKHGLANILDNNGFVHQVGDPDPEGGYAALFVASKLPLTPGKLAYGHSRDAHRLIHMKVDTTDWDVIAAYIPGVSKGNGRKGEFWQFILDEVDPACCGTPTVVCGDLNTGLHYRDELGATFICSEHMAELQSRGWRDAWIERNPTSRPPASWWSPKFGNPFRLD